MSEPAGTRPEGFRLVRNTAVNAAAQVIAIITGFLLLPYMLARMGTELYGLVLIAQIFSISGVMAYADGGLASAATRYMAAYYAEGRMEDVRRVLVTTIVAFLGIGAILGLGIWAFTQWAFFRFFSVPAQHVQDVRNAVYLYAVTLGLQFAVLAIKGLYAAVQDQVSIKIWETTTRLTYTGAVVAVLVFSRTVFAIVMVEQVVVLGISLVYLLLARHWYRSAFSLNPQRASVSTFKQIGSFGAHVFVNYFTTYGVYQKLPDIFISHFLGPASLTYYAIINKIPRIIKTLTAAANNAATPFAAALDGLDMRSKLSSLVLRGARYSYLVLTPSVLFVLVFAEQILSVWMGSQYAWLADMLRVFVVWQYVMFFVLYTNATITRTEQYAHLLPYSIAANVTFIATMWLTIQRWQLWSVLAAQILSMLVLAAGSLAVQRRTHAFGFADLFDEVVKLPILVGGGVALLAFSLVKVSLAPRGLIALLTALAAINGVYVALVYRYGLEHAERTQILRLVRRAARR